MMFGLNWIVIAVIASLAVLLGIEELRISGLKTEHAEYVQEVEKRARIAADDALQEQSRRQQAFDEEAQHARNEIKQLESSVVALADARDGLSDDLSAALKRASQKPKYSSGSAGKPSADARDLLSQLYLGSVRTNQELAEAADRLRIAGISCERSSDSLNRAPGM